MFQVKKYRYSNNEKSDTRFTTISQPDHVVIEVSDTPFYVRIQEIIWITLT